jgi:hypothetical protein
MKIVESCAYFGDTARPSRPPSPLGLASEMVCTVLTTSPFALDFGPTLRIFRVSRSVTSAAPSGRKSIAHGTSRPLAMTVATTSMPSSPLAVADGVGWGRLGGPLPGSFSGSPNAQAASVLSIRAATARSAAILPRRGVTGLTIAVRHLSVP